MVNNRDRNRPNGYCLLKGSYNYQALACKTKAMLTLEDVWRAVDPAAPYPPISTPVTSSTSTTQITIKKVASDVDEDINNEACALFTLQVSHSISRLIGGLRTAKEMWKKSQALYQETGVNSYWI